MSDKISNGLAEIISELDQTNEQVIRQQRALFLTKQPKEIYQELLNLTNQEDYSIKTYQFIKANSKLIYNSREKSLESFEKEEEIFLQYLNNFSNVGMMLEQNKNPEFIEKTIENTIENVKYLIKTRNNKEEWIINAQIIKYTMTHLIQISHTDELKKTHKELKTLVGSYKFRSNVLIPASSRETKHQTYVPKGALVRDIIAISTRLGFKPKWSNP